MTATPTPFRTASALPHGRRGLIAAAALAACLPLLRPAAARRTDGALAVLATTSMIGDLAREIGAGRIALHVMMGPGVDPHLYRATREDMARMLRADVILYNGLLLEGKLADALVRVARAGRHVQAVTEQLPEEDLLQVADGVFDPHVWMDPTLWSKAAEVVASALVREDPPGEADYRANLASLQERLAALDAYAAGALATVPERRRLLVTAHDAFGYFGRRYGVEVEGIQGLSTESEAGVRRIGELAALLAARGVPAVFVESSVPERNVRALMEAAAALGQRVTIGGTLFSDSMGDPGSYEGTYIGMMDHNVTTIVRALGGSAPERGFQGRLSRPR